MIRRELAQRFDELLLAYGPSLARLAASYARGASEHDDLFQEIALAIWRALPSFRGDCSERTFVFRIAHNRGISCLARRVVANFNGYRSSIQMLAADAASVTYRYPAAT